MLELEVVRGIADELYLLARGYEVTPYVVWIVVHAIIIATGLRALRHAQLLPRGNTRRDPAKVDA